MSNKTNSTTELFLWNPSLTTLAQAVGDEDRERMDRLRNGMRLTVAKQSVEFDEAIGVVNRLLDENTHSEYLVDAMQRLIDAADRVLLIHQLFIGNVASPSKNWDT